MSEKVSALLLTACWTLMKLTLDDEPQATLYISQAISCQLFTAIVPAPDSAKTVGVEETLVIHKRVTSSV